MLSFLKILFPILGGDSFLNGLTTVFNSLIIVSFFVWAVYYLWYRRCQCSKPIDQALKELAAFADTPSNFEELNEKLSNCLGETWKSFRKTLVESSSDLTGPPSQILGWGLCRTVEAKQFFNDYTLVWSKLNFRFFSFVPSLFTGLGILGTFVGLTLGLTQVDLHTEDVEVLKEGIKALLGGAGTAFSTSLLGISFSLLFSIVVDKLWFSRSLSQKIRTLQQKLDDSFPIKTAEKWLAEGLREAREQTAELKRFNTDLAISIASALDEKLAERLTPALQNLLLAIQELTSAGAAEVAKSIRHSAGEEIRHLGEVLADARSTLETAITSSLQVQQNMAETVNGLLGEMTLQQQRLQEQTQNAATKFMAQMETLITQSQEQFGATLAAVQGQLVNQVKTMTEKMAAVVTSLSQQSEAAAAKLRQEVENMAEQIGRRIQELLACYREERIRLQEGVEKVKALLVQVGQVIAEAESAARSFAQSAVPMQDTAANLQTATAKLHDAQEQWVRAGAEVLAQLGCQVDQVTKASDQVRQSLEATSSSWRAYENKFGSLRQDLEAVFGQLSQGLQEYREITGDTIQSYLRELDTHLDRAVGLLSSAIEELKEPVEELAQSSSRLEQVASGLNHAAATSN
ncbi:MAG: anti-phage defense ZorAB system ZorA [Clostridia bacterium]|nr:anti-phage defense ZorAB system ZorA [Clostridia bacterium]